MTRDRRRRLSLAASVLAAAALVLAGGPATAGEPDVPDSEDFRIGRLAYRGCDWQQAITRLSKADQSFPDHPAILQTLAASYQNANQPLAAMACWQGYLRLGVPADDARRAREQLDLLDASVQKTVNDLFAQAVELAEKSLRPNRLAKAWIAEGRDPSDPIALAKEGELGFVAQLQARAGRLQEARDTDRLARLRCETDRVQYGPYPRDHESACFLALAETGSITPLDDAAQRGDFEAVQLCYLARLVARAPGYCGALARTYAADDAFRNLKLVTLESLRPADGTPPHLALADVARRVSIELLRCRALTLRSWERDPDSLGVSQSGAMKFLVDWVLQACEGGRPNRLADRSPLGGSLFASRCDLVARAIAGADNVVALTFQVRGDQRHWPLLALVWRSSEPWAQSLADAFAAIGYGALTRDAHGNTPLLAACSGANPAAMRVLLEHGGGLTLSGPDGARAFLALPWALVDEPEAVDLLVARGADVSCTDWAGNTPLHLAALHDCPKMVAALCAGKARIGATNKAGKTPLELARDKGHRATIDVLVRLGAAR